MRGRDTGFACSGYGPSERGRNFEGAAGVGDSASLQQAERDTLCWSADPELMYWYVGERDQADVENLGVWQCIYPAFALAAPRTKVVRVQVHFIFNKSTFFKYGIFVSILITEIGIMVSATIAIGVIVAVL